jgi:hypothetical protein
MLPYLSRFRIVAAQLDVYRFASLKFFATAARINVH